MEHFGESEHIQRGAISFRSSGLGPRTCVRLVAGKCRFTLKAVIFSGHAAGRFLRLILIRG